MGGILKITGYSNFNRLENKATSIQYGSIAITFWLLNWIR